MNNGIDVKVLLNGNLLQAKGLARFTYITPSSAKQYLIYTLNEKTIKDDKELYKIYVSETSEMVGYEFQPISIEEWEELKKIMNALRQPDATPPSNVQMSKLQPIQYTVGEYKKIGVDESFIAHLIQNQKNNEPKNDTIIPPSNTSGTEFFDKSVTQEAEQAAPVAQATTVPDAFSMTAPVAEANPQETTNVPTEETTTQVVENTEEQSQETLVQPTIQPEKPKDEPAFVTKSVTDESYIPDNASVPKEVLTGFYSFLQYVGADMNKVNEVFKTGNINPLPAIIDREEGESVAVTPVTTKPIEIENLPIIEQTPLGDDTHLVEDPIVPGAPSLPVDDMDSKPEKDENTYTAVSNNMEPVEEEKAEAPSAVVEPVQQEPVTPIAQPAVVEPVAEEQQQVIEQPVATKPVQQESVVPIEQSAVVEQVTEEQPQVIEQPVATEPVQEASTAIIEQPTVSEPVAEEQPQMIEQPTTVQLIEPVEPEIIEQPTSTDATAPAQTEVAEQPAEANNELLAPVQTEIIESPPDPPVISAPQTNETVDVPAPSFEIPNPEAPAVEETAETTEPEFEVPVEKPGFESPQSIAPVDAPQDSGTPPIEAVTPEEQQQLAPASQPTETATATVDTSFLDAGPVIMPVGQEGISSQGLPGDSGLKVLEKAA